MSQSVNCFTSGTPSSRRTLLQELVGKRVGQAIRYSWLAPNEAVTQYGFDKDECFSLTAGPLAIEFDSGLIAAFASDPALASVVCWTERDMSGTWREERLDQDAELFPISANDKSYSSPLMNSLVGATVATITILTRPPVNHKWDELPREVGLRIVTTSGVTIWLTHGLHDDSDDFSVLEESQLLPELRSILMGICTIGSDK